MLKNFLSLFVFLSMAFCVTAYAQESPQPPTAYAPWTNDDIAPPLRTDPPAPPSALSESSALEAMYAERVLDEPQQFGYDLFSSEKESRPSDAPMGAVQDDFILGSGDELLITFTGQRSDQKSYIIDSNGQIVIQDLPPFSVTGRTIKQFRDSLNAQIASMHNTMAYVSLSSARQIGVLIVGHVKHPGRKNLNVFHTVIDALNQAGGIEKDGSLRQIKLVRSGRSTVIDLYSLLMSGAPFTDMRLRNGDRIIVPPIGPTVAISGAVKRPGIYELRKISTQISEALSLNQMLEFAGGTLSSGQNRFIKQANSLDGQEIIVEITDPLEKTFTDGAILSVSKGEGKRQGTVELKGETRRAGLYDLSQNKTLSSLLKNEDSLGDDIYPLIGVLTRWNKDQLATSFKSFPIRLVLTKEFDEDLQSGDTVLLFSNEYISSLYDKEPDDLKAHYAPPKTFSNKIFQDIALKSYLKERTVFVRGAVRKAGSYPIAEGTTLDNIMAVAGGMTLSANFENIEITSKNLNGIFQDTKNPMTKRTTVNLNESAPESIEISAGDTIRVNQKARKTDEKTVLIIGEILHPGEYDLEAGDTVSDLIQRAGGITDQAYPAGAIFSRESERRTEEMRFRAAAQDMEQRLAAAIQRDKNPPDTAQIEMVRALADELSHVEAVGRITVETDPYVLNEKPELNMLLEKGDRIYIPKRPLTVRVSGEILSPANLQFRKEKDPLDYIHEAGGFTYHADKERAFVLYPDGSAQPLRVSNWNHTPILIPPGSTIVVPRDPKPFDFIQSAKEIGGILSNLAITSVFIDDIRK